MGNWLARNGHAKAALTIYQRHLRDYPAGKGAAEAHAYAGLLQLHAFREPTAAYQHLMDTLDLKPSPDIESVVREGLNEIAAAQNPRNSRLAAAAAKPLQFVPEDGLIEASTF